MSLFHVIALTSDIFAELEDPECFLYKFHTALAGVAVLFVASAVVTLMWNHFRDPCEVFWIACTSMSVFSISDSFTLSRRKRFDPDGHIKKIKSLISPYFACYGVVLLGITLKLWCEITLTAR